ncbi:carbohydrate ABC transporter membrane protein 1 (CUT1 family) [Hydrogenispora ethanolica]|uniref:Carbohydrate ABC transporter membrane protein 1 (CUT1 family) n=1 Tax=Hydrogenispora ethanolica TaxID=1082276 RepID=A0A4R1RA12_HYDET|nr:sugar ABC transporter permease [Hydrogenispora ethanolica]TCL62536.1 carbohydrate ABC transporter membrane protein 1 (CUT1 family) [Hydrogenispora ethanolica]
MKKNSLQSYEARDAYLLIAPLLVLVLVFILFPVISNFYYCFTDWKGFGAVNWIGFDNFSSMFQDDKFWQSLNNTLFLFLFIPLGAFVPLTLAALLRGGLKGWKFFRAIIYLPNVLGYVILGMIFNLCLRSDGPFNSLLRLVGLHSLALDWMSQPFLALLSLGLIYGVWMRIGFGTIYFLAAMGGIDEQLYESARIDGAGWWTIFWRITLPSIRFNIEFWIVMSVIENVARAFSFIYAFSKGGPGYSTYTLEYGLYGVGFINGKMGYASAWATVLFFICAIIAIIQIRLMRRPENE